MYHFHTHFNISTPGRELQTANFQLLLHTQSTESDLAEEPHTDGQYILFRQVQCGRITAQKLWSSVLGTARGSKCKWHGTVEVFHLSLLCCCCCCCCCYCFCFCCYWESSVWVSTNRSTPGHTLCSRRIFEKKWEYNEEVHHLFIDFKKAYDSFRREVLSNILIDTGNPMKLVRLIKMCLTETYCRVRVGKHLSDTFCC